jgi:hypothetical protein
MKKIACVCFLFVFTVFQTFALSEYYFVYFQDSTPTGKYAKYFERSKNPVHILYQYGYFYGFVVMPNDKSEKILIIKTTYDEDWPTSHDVISVQEMSRQSLDKTWGYNKIRYWWTVEGEIYGEPGFRCKLITNDF